MRLLIEPQADEKIRAYTALVSGEISGLGKVTVDGDDFIVTDVAIFEQEVSGVHSTIPTAALAKFQDEMVKKGESMREWVLWWHSHADMDVFFSSTDTDTIYNSTEFPFLVSLVVNKARESKARVDVYKPVHMYMELDVEVISKTSEAIKELCKADIEAKVQKPKKQTGFLTDIPPRSSKGIQPPYSSILADDDDQPDFKPRVITYAEGEEEYSTHKKMLLRMLKKARKFRNQAEVYRLEGELAEWLLFGKSMGFEITRLAE